MLKRIVMQMTGLGTALCIRLWALLTALLWNPVNSLLANFTLKFQSVVSLKYLCAKIVLSINLCRAPLITAVQSTRVVLTFASQRLIQIGLQLLTTVRQIPQHVVRLLLKGK